MSSRVLVVGHQRMHMSRSFGCSLQSVWLGTSDICGSIRVFPVSSLSSVEGALSFGHGSASVNVCSRQAGLLKVLVRPSRRENAWL